MLQEWFGLPVPEIIKNVFHGTENAINFGLTQFLLLLPILYINRNYFMIGFKRLFKGTPNMDSLIAIGSGVATLEGIFAINKSGYLKMKATKVGEHTTLAQIIKLVEEASNSKAPIAKIADKVSSVFVPTVIAIAILTVIIWLMVLYFANQYRCGGKNHDMPEEMYLFNI